MARPKKVKKEEVEDVTFVPVEEIEVAVEQLPVVPTPITTLTVDYASEGLNDMARKINELINRVNAL